MGERWALAFVAIAAAARPLAAPGDPATAGAGGVSAPGGICELRHSDRASTPSRLCISCHDGSTGPGVRFQMRRAPDGGDVGMSHPVDVDYAAAAARHQGKYAPAGELPHDVPLVDGKVECTSCHDGSSTSANRLVEPARLCYACHRL